MEKQFIDLVVHVFTFQWAIWAIPISLLASFLVRRVAPALVIALFAVILHNAGPSALPALLGGESVTLVIEQLGTIIPKLEPISVLAEYVAYAFLIVVFSLTRQDMFRPSVQ